MKLNYVLLFLLLMLRSVSASDTFYFTAIPDEDSSRLEERFSEVAKYLEKSLGVPVKYIPVKSYSASVTAFKNNRVQLAWFGGLSGVKARIAVPGSQAIAQGEEDVSFKSYFIAHSSSGLLFSDEFPKELEGKTFLFGSKGSTSGRLMPEFFFRRYMNDAPDQVCDRVGFSGDHSRTLALVQAGSYQVGALNYAVWDSALKAGKIDASKVSVIWETPTYPDYNWTIRAGVDHVWGTGFSNKVKAALLGMSDEKLLKSFPRSKFISAQNQDYQPILDTAKKLGIIRE